MKHTFCTCKKYCFYDYSLSKSANIMFSARFSSEINHTPRCGFLRDGSQRISKSPHTSGQSSDSHFPKIHCPSPYIRVQWCRSRRTGPLRVTNSPIKWARNTEMFPIILWDTRRGEEKRNNKIDYDQKKQRKSAVWKREEYRKYEKHVGRAWKFFPTYFPRSCA